ncbi:MAG TPA: ABC transporter permease subunit [Candidatus Dormibacteraeota bacterium]|nr:ABC transporter permease subunit [Candidatus Dormibacteraeota bacterium]
MFARIRRNLALSRLWWALCIGSLVLAMLILLSLFGFVFVRGIAAIHPDIFLTVTSGIAGGLANAIAGTFMLVALALLLVVPVGIGAAIWVTQFAPVRMRFFVRLAIDVLFGVPSIVIGYFLYVALVEAAGWGFSLFAGGLALAIIMLPYVYRAADLSFSAVPRDLVEASVALGARSLTTFIRISFPWSLPGTLTGLLIGVGIALGETAPLIYTAGWSSYMPTLKLTHAPIAYLTYVVWTFINEPFKASHQLAYAAAFLLMLLIFVTNFVARAAVEYWASKTRSHA